MSRSPSGPLALSALRALAGKDRGSAAPAPPSWTLRGALCGRPLDRIRGAVSGFLDSPRAAGLAASLERLSRRPLLVLGPAVLAAPLLRLAVPGPSGEVLALAALALPFVVLALALGTGLHEGRERRIVLLALLAGLALRLALGAAVHLRGGFPDEFHTYHPLAADSAACWRTGGPSLLFFHPVVENRAAYFYLLSGSYLLAGEHVVTGRVLGGILGLFTALMAGEVARPLGGRRAAALAVAVLALHPEHALWSTTLSRDTLATLLLLAAFAAVLHRPGALLRGNLLLAAVPLALLSMNSFLLAGALAAVLLVMAGAEAVAGARGAARVPAVAAVAVLAGAALVYVGHRWGNFFTPGLFTAVRSRTIGTDPDFLPGLEFGGVGDLLAFLPLGSLFVLFAPWPWTAVHLHRFLYGLLSLAGMAVTILGLYGLLAAGRRRPAAALPPLLFVALLLALLALLEGTSGIVVRHRLPITGILCAGAGVALAGLRVPARP